MDLHDKKYITLFQGGVLALALWVRWSFAGSVWSHGDEWAFIIHPLGFWSGDFNPHFFNYPTFQLYINSALYYLYYLSFAAEPLEEFVAYHYFIEDGSLLVLARAISVLIAVATVALVIALGRRLYGAWGGLLAGLVLALMPLQTRFSHLAITDVPATFWTTAALLLAVRLLQEGRERDLLLAGVCTGLAAATKYPAGLVLVPVLASELLRRFTLANRYLWLATLLALCAFSLATPYVWLDFETFWADLSVMGREHVLAEQSHELSSFVYLWLHTLRYGMGTVALCIFFLALLQKPRHWRREEAVLLVGLFVFAALLAMAESRYMRYALPMAPLLAVLVVRPFAHWQQRNRAVLAGALLFLLVEPAHTSLRMHALLNQQDTRAQFQQWLYQRWPNGQRLIFSPTRIRYRPPVNFSDQLVRQKCYINSFGATGLIRAYSLLSQRADLPPVYNYYSWERISAFVAAPGDGVVDTAIAVHHDHPLSVSEASVLRLEEMAGVISWQELWNPGSFSDAVFDWQDAYYVPVAGWNDAERAGPAIEVGYLPLKNKLRILPTAREYFALVPLVLQAHQHMDRGEWAVSIERYESVLNSPFYLAELLPFSQYYIIYEDLAYAYEQMGNIDQSLYYWQQALELRPDQMHIYFNIGLIYIALNDLESALRYLHKAHELDTADPDILMNMGICYIELGQFAEGIDSLERRVALGADADAYIALGQAYGLAGRIGEQKVYYLRALELAPNHAQTE